MSCADHGYPLVIVNSYLGYDDEGFESLRSFCDFCRLVAGIGFDQHHHCVSYVNASIS